MALDIFKKNIKVTATLDRTLDMVDAISLLYRLKLDCCELPLRDEWNEIARTYVSRKEEHGYVFNDSHVAMMLSESSCLGKEEEDSFFSSLDRYLKADNDDGSLGFLKKLNGEYAERIYKAIMLFRAEDFSSVVDQLYPIRYEIIRIGGSNAQRDIFQQMLIQAALRSELDVHRRMGMALLDERRALKPNAKLTERLAARFASSE